MGDSCVRIDRFQNGYTVEIKDPAIVKYNDKRDNSGKGPYKPYKEPWKTFVFTDVAQVTKFLTKNLPKAVIATDDDEFGTAFTAANAAPEAPRD